MLNDELPLPPPENIQNSRSCWFPSVCLCVSLCVCVCRCHRPGMSSALLLQWAEGLVSGRKGIAVIFDSNRPWFEQTTCEEASGGVETIGGWRCIFQEMPHLCIFDNRQVCGRLGWRIHLKRPDHSKQSSDKNPMFYHPPKK